MCAQILLATVLLLATVQTILSSAYDALCPIDANPKNRALLPHPKDCSKFLVCFNGVAHVPSCPANLHWNREQQACDFPSKAGCKVLPSQPTECVHGDFYADEGSCETYYYCQDGRKVPRTCGAGFHWHQKQRNCVAPHKSSCQQTTFKRWRNADAHLACPAKDDPAHPVHLPYAGDCSLFLKCSNGRAWRMECPMGLLWNAEKNHCDYAFLTKCSAPVNEMIEMHGNDGTNINTGQHQPEAIHPVEDKLMDFNTNELQNPDDALMGKNLSSHKELTQDNDPAMPTDDKSLMSAQLLDKTSWHTELNFLNNALVANSVDAGSTEYTPKRASTTASTKLAASTPSDGSEIRTTPPDASIHSTLAIEPVAAQSQHGSAPTTGAATSTTKWARSTLDPHLPFRAPQCLGDKNRVKFPASTNEQFYQCFEGFAYLLNCHGGYVFSTLASKCVASATASC